jgi:diguanylate cyclase (GGDEF)-like protein
MAAPAEGHSRTSPSETTAADLSFWRRLWSTPEPEISTVGFAGELLVAGVRLLLITALLYFPIRELLRKPSGYDPLALLTTATVGLVFALVVYAATQRQWARSWIGFASSLLDVSLVSAMLGVFLLLGRPYEAVNNLEIFAVYFLAIAATSLRYDSRICMITGALALAQYAALVIYADWRWELSSAPLSASTFGVFSWSSQIWRMLQLAGATLIAATVVVRTKELRFLSTRDRFTGLMNRAVFNEQLEREVARAQRENGRFAVAMVDIDHFKRFNDTHGHAGGDIALRLVAQTLRDSCRATDVVARYGGEEFALILPGVMSAKATDLLERIRRVMAVKPIRLPGRHKPASVSISIGVALWPDDGESSTEVLRCADQRLYLAKAQGRDRVIGPAGQVQVQAQENQDRLEATTVSMRLPGIDADSLR